MKKRILLVVLAALLAGGLNAQSEKETKKKEKGKFGAFLGRVGEQATGINMTNEPFIVNPLSSSCDVELVGAYGNTAGTVSLVFRIKNKTDEKANFGGSSYKTEAYDAKGKVYKQSIGYNRSYDTPKGLWVEVRMDGDYAFSNVPVGLASLELINVYCFLNRNTTGMIEFRNIPIQWGVDPE